MNNRKEYFQEYYLKNKESINLKGQEYYQENKEKISKRTKNYYNKFPWIRKVIQAHHRCENVNDISYKNYGAKGIKCLLTFDEAKTLWFRDKAWELKEPSLDRIESTKDYTIDNCRFIEKRLNSILRNYENNNKKIIQYSLDGQLIKEWSSLTEAQEFLGVGRNSLYQVLSHRYNDTNIYRGYIWRYK